MKSSLGVFGWDWDWDWDWDWELLKYRLEHSVR